MKPVCLLFLIAAGLPVEAATVLKTGRAAHMLALNAVYLNGEGPFRMLIDTGNSSSLIAPWVARRLHLRPQQRLEQATPAGSRMVPAAVLAKVQIGKICDQRVETMIGDVPLSGVDGILGQSWLIRHDYLLDYRGRRLVMDGLPPEGGTQQKLHVAEGLPQITAHVNGQPSELVLDSGAPAVVLYQSSSASHPVTLLTAAGSLAAENGSARVEIGGLRRLLAAVRVNAPGTTPGLLPLNAFSRVYVSNHEGFVIFEP